MWTNARKIHAMGLVLISQGLINVFATLVTNYVMDVVKVS